VPAPEKTPSSIPPHLIAALICDVAVMDPSTRKVSLVGIFDRIGVGTFPTSRQMSLYFKLTDAQGFYPVRVDFVRVDDDTLLARVEGQLESQDPTRSYDAHFDFPPLPIPRAGRYAFHIHASNMYLGSAFIDAVPRG
jgi:hypothetical protein